MKKSLKWIIAGGAVGVLALVGFGFWARGGSEGPMNLSVGTCETDTEIPAKTRALYDAAATHFIEAMMKSDIAGAYATFSTRAKSSMSPEKFAQNMAPIGAVLSSMKPPQVAHSYYLTTAAIGDADKIVPCTIAAAGSTATPDGSVFVAEKPIPEQAHILVTAPLGDDTLTFVFWVVTEDGAQHIEAINISQTTMAGKSANDLLTMARTEKSKDHGFNAAMLYAGAGQLAYRSPTFRLGISTVIQDELKTLKLPPELQGKPPFAWEFQGDHFNVLAVGTLAIDGKLGLGIRQQLSPFPGDDNEADARNRLLIRRLIAAYPDVAAQFRSIAVEIVDETGQRGFRTIYDPEKAPAPTP